MSHDGDHWRDKKAATDWASLKFQVRRWLDASNLGWSEGDIQDVTRYLNESIYRYPPITDPMTSLEPFLAEPTLAQGRPVGMDIQSEFVRCIDVHQGAGSG